ncbi:hypothetical protein BJ742DRAFT_772315 [Cladochytrium replicatum]|nr:hypothetical protein BJ742DRAFT_772315 [Cladochytrium replicatum]
MSKDAKQQKHHEVKKSLRIIIIISEDVPLQGHPSSAHSPFHCRRRIVTSFIAGVAATAVVAIPVSTVQAPPLPPSRTIASTGITREAFYHGLRVCSAFKIAGQGV